MTDISAEELIERLKKEILQTTNWARIGGLEKAIQIVDDLTKGRN
jgi:hypothetical protein